MLHEGRELAARDFRKPEREGGLFRRNGGLRNTERMMIEVERINSYYRIHTSWFNVPMAVRAAEVVALLGRTGAGKSPRR